MMYGYGILNNHVPTLKATAMRGGSAPSPLLTSLYAVYKAESNANDSLATYNGTAQGGLTYSAGKSGNAFTFNGSTAAISYPSNSMNLTGDFSISAWINLPLGYNAGQELTILMNLNCDGAWYSNLKGFWLAVSGNNTFFSVFDGINQNAVNWDDSTGSIIKANSGWVHVAATRKASTGSKLYLNGVLKASDTNTNDATYHTNYQVPTTGRRYILDRTGGVANNSTYATTNANIDELNIWSKELTSTEITELYNTGTGKFYPY